MKANLPDSVGTYLKEVNALPLMSQHEEVNVTKQLENVRRRFRRVLSANDYVLHLLVRRLDAFRKRGSRVDQVMEATKYRPKTARQVRSELARVIKAIRRLLSQNRRDARKLRNSDPCAASTISERMRKRRYRAIRLIEELYLRPSQFPPLLDGLRNLAERMETPNASIGEREKLVLFAGEARQQVSHRLSLATRLRKRYLELRRELASRNLRLVIAIAKRYRNRGVAFLDLVQEGTMGLMRAVDKFESCRGLKFSTYATWWIRQTITRAVSQQSRTVRVPVQSDQNSARVRRVFHSAHQSTGIRPSLDETADMAGLTIAQTEAAMAAMRRSTSLDEETHSDSEGSLADLLVDDSAPSSAEVVDQKQLEARISRLLDELPKREREVISMRYGIGDGRPRTLAEVGQRYQVSRERIRQIEVSAMQRLQASKQTAGLQGFLDTFGTSPDRSSLHGQVS